jgi:hypothetical protein
MVVTPDVMFKGSAELRLDHAAELKAIRQVIPEAGRWRHRRLDRPADYQPLALVIV